MNEEINTGIGFIDVVCIIVVAIGAICGWKKGFARSLIGFLSFGAAAVSAIMLRPVVTDLLSETPLADKIYLKILPAAADGADKTNDGFFWQNFNIQDGVTNAIVNLVISVAAILIIFVAVRILILIASKILIKVSRLPIIGGADKVLGLLLSGAKWSAVVVLGLIVLIAFGTLNNPRVADAVNTSVLCKLISENLLKMFLGA